MVLGSCKVHKKCADGCPPLRPNLSALQTPAYELAKYLVSILEPLTNNKDTVNDSSEFAPEIVHQNSSKFMGSLGIDSLSTNIPFE